MSSGGEQSLPRRAPWASLTPHDELTTMSSSPHDELTSGAHEIFDKGYADYLFNGMNAYPPNQREMMPSGYPMPNDRFTPTENERKYV